MCEGAYILKTKATHEWTGQKEAGEVIQYRKGKNGFALIDTDEGWIETTWSNEQLDRYPWFRRFDGVAQTGIFNC